MQLQVGGAGVPATGVCADLARACTTRHAAACIGFLAAMGSGAMQSPALPCALHTPAGGAPGECAPQRRGGAPHAGGGRPGAGALGGWGAGWACVALGGPGKPREQLTGPGKLRLGQLQLQPDPPQPSTASHPQPAHTQHPPPPGWLQEKEAFQRHIKDLAHKLAAARAQLPEAAAAAARAADEAAAEDAEEAAAGEELQSDAFAAAQLRQAGSEGGSSSGGEGGEQPWLADAAWQRLQAAGRRQGWLVDPQEVVLGEVIGRGTFGEPGCLRSRRRIKQRLLGVLLRAPLGSLRAVPLLRSSVHCTPAPNPLPPPAPHHARLQAWCTRPRGAAGAWRSSAWRCAAGSRRARLCGRWRRWRCCATPTSCSCTPPAWRRPTPSGSSASCSGGRACSRASLLAPAWSPCWLLCGGKAAQAAAAPACHA